ncbi:MAG: peptide chain release factor N(5)-glutamine methyltransferase [Cyanobacteriota bacterium]
MNLLDFRNNAIKELGESGVLKPEAIAEVDLLLYHILNITKKDLYLSNNFNIPDEKINLINDNLSKRINENVPIQYLLNCAYFYNLKLFVNEHVLIPRNDTEILVEKAIELIKNNNYKNIADIGTGSGNISISILTCCNDINIVATDISEEALKVTELNCNSYQVRNRIKLFQTSFLETIHNRLDLIISNPPYIPEYKESALAREVREYEPRNALYVSSIDPIENYKIISEQASKLLVSGGALLVEVDSEYAIDVKEYLETNGWVNAIIYNDLNSLPRVVLAFQN